MANVIYNKFKQGVMQGSYNLESFPVFVALVNNSYTPDIDNQSFVGTILAQFEVAGTNYVAGGHALSNPSVAQDNANDLGNFDADDWTLGTASLTARGAVLYGSSGAGAASDPLICFFDFTTDKTATAGDFTIQWNASGIINAT